MANRSARPKKRVLLLRERRWLHMKPWKVFIVEKSDSMTKVIALTSAFCLPSKLQLSNQGRSGRPSKHSIPKPCSFRSNYSRLKHIMKFFRVRLIELRLFRKKRESANWHTRYFPPVRTKRLAAIIIGRKMRVFRVVKEAPDQWPFLISICYH